MVVVVVVIAVAVLVLVFDSVGVTVRMTVLLRGAGLRECGARVVAFGFQPVDPRTERVKHDGFQSAASLRNGGARLVSCYDFFWILPPQSLQA